MRISTLLIITLLTTIPCATPADARLPSMLTTTLLSNQGQRESLDKALEEVHVATGVSIVSDALASEAYTDGGQPAVRGTALERLRTIASRCGREVTEVDGIYVLRVRDWGRYRAAAKKPDAIKWQTSGFVSVQRLDAPEDSALPNPAREIAIKGRQVSIALIAASLRERANYNVTVEPALAGYRFHVFAKRVSPSALVGALAFLLNGGPEVQLRQSPEQKDAERYAEFANAPDFIKKRIRESDKLRKELEPLLTEEQKKTLESGGRVEMPMSQIPEKLRMRVVEYVSQAAMYSGNVVAPPDLSRQSEFAIRFHPNNGREELWYMLGIRMVSPDGTIYNF
jgi:hypothetical protein